MENYKITAAQILASSQFSATHAPNQGRLHLKAGGGYSGGWSAGTNNSSQWFQIDLRIATIVTFVGTQGRNGNLDQRVTKYKLQYSKGGVTFQVYKQTGENSDKVGRFYVIWSSHSRHQNESLSVQNPKSHSLYQ